MTCEDPTHKLLGCNWNFGDIAWRYAFSYVMILVIAVPTATLVYLLVEKPAMDARKVFKNEHAGSSFE